MKVMNKYTVYFKNNATLSYVCEFRQAAIINIYFRINNVNYSYSMWQKGKFNQLQ